MQRSIQGCSKMTLQKEEDLKGFTSMSLLKNYKHDGEYLIADIFCGDGNNIIDDQIIDGSPKTLSRATTHF